MKKLFRFTLITAVVLSLSSAAFAWRFASIADSRGNDKGINSEILNKIIDRINAEKVDLMIMSGDLVDAKNDDDVSSMLDGWKSLMSRLNCRYYVSLGNHDVRGPRSEDIAREKFDHPTNGPRGYEELVYSFDYQNACFISLYSEKRGDAHRIHPAQRAWLRVNLAQNKQPHVFVFTHDPAYPKGPHIGSSLDKYPQERDALWSLLSSHGCRMFFCGHEHLYARDDKDGVYQVINGTCGAPISKGVTGTVGRYQYVIVDIDGTKVKCTAKDEDGKLIDSWNYSLAN